MSRGVPLWAKVAIATFVVLLVAGVGGPYVYIHFIEGKAPTPLSVDTSSSPAPAASSAAPATSGEPTSSSVNGTWAVASGSVVGYRVHEILLGQSNTATGRTSSVTGTLTVASDTVSSASFSADLTKVASDKPQRDRQFQGRI